MNVQTLIRGLLIVACCCVLNPSPTSAGDKPRPFRGSAEGVVTDLIIDPETNQLAGFHAVWAGQATHLGHFTREEVLFFDDEPFGSFTGMMVFTAANGDQLTLDFDGAFTPGPGDAQLATGAYTFTGGTGRFEGATGTATYDAVAIGFDAIVAFEGTIRYGKNR